jgi:hypothetical protein
VEYKFTARGVHNYLSAIVEALTAAIKNVLSPNSLTIIIINDEKKASTCERKNSGKRATQVFFWKAYEAHVKLFMPVLVVFIIIVVV